MDKLNSEGIRFDEQGHIKIISEVTENNSKHLLGQIDLLVNGLIDVKQKLTDTISQLERIDRLTGEYRKAKLAKNITDLCDKGCDNSCSQ